MLNVEQRSWLSLLQKKIPYPTLFIYSKVGEVKRAINFKSDMKRVNIPLAIVTIQYL